MFKSRLKIKLRTWVGIILILILFPIVAFLLFKPGSVGAEWFDDAFKYRQRFSFVHNASITSARAITFTLDTAELITAGVMQADCDDTRFTDAGGRSLRYDLTGTCNNASTTYEVIFDEIINGTNVGYVYYGSTTAINAETDSTAFTALTPSGGDPSAITDRTNETQGPSPVAYWKFDEGVDNTCSGGSNDACDSSSDAKDGAFGATTAAPTWQTEDMCMNGKCLLFDGSNDTVTVSSISGVKTVSFWVKILSTSTTEQIIDLNGGTDALSSVSGVLTATGFGTETIYVDGNSGATTLTAGRWHHVAVTTSSGLTASAITLGNISTNYGNFFIDDLKFYNYARTAAQVKTEVVKNSSGDGSSAIFGSSNKNISDGLVGYWKLNESSGNSSDFSGNALTLTNNGTTIFVSAKFANGSEHVPASSQYLSTATSVSGVKAVSFWVNPDSTTNNFFQLTASDYVTSSSGTISVTGFGSNEKIYVNGVESSTIVADTWQLITIASDTSITANAIEIGRANGSYFDGTLDEVRFYNKELTFSEARDLYNWAPGPTASWNFNESTGTTFYDNSGNSKNLSSIISESQRVSGFYGGGLYIGFLDNFPTLADDDEFDFNSASFTYTGFFNSSVTGSTTATILSKNYDATNIAYRLYLENGIAKCGIDDDGVSFPEDVASSTLTYNDGKWHHIACVKNANTALILYVDGVEVGRDSSISATGNVAGATDLNIGYSVYGVFIEEYALGKLDEINFYRYPLSQKGVIQDMNGGHPVGGSPISSQSVYWKFDEMTGTTTYDGASLTSSNGTITGASWITNSVCKINSCLNFDATTEMVALATASDAEVDFASSEEFSGSVWVYPTSVQASTTEKRAIISKWDETSTLRGYRLYLENDDTDSTGNFEVQIYDESTDQVITATSTLDEVSANNWYHIGFSFNGGVAGAAGDLKIYLNGVHQASNSANASFLGLEDIAVDFAVGNYDVTDVVAANTAFVGYIDDVKIYNAVLTTDEFLIDMNANSAINFGSGTVETGSAATSPLIYYSFDSNSGSTVYDLSGGSYNATFEPAVGMSDDNWKPGKIGSSLYFDNSNDRIVASDYPDFTATQDFTISVWLKHPISASTDSAVSKKRGTAVTNIGYELYLSSSSNQINFVASEGANGVNDAFELDGINLSDNVWEHVVVVWDDDSTTNTDIYINGVKQNATQTGTLANVGDLSNTDSLTLGAEANNNDTNYGGWIDEFKIFNYALPQNEISYLYNRGKPMFWYKFDECSGAVLNNTGGLSGYNAAITIGATGTYTSTGSCGSGTSTEAWNAGTSGKRNYSLGFDNTDDYATITTPELPVGDFTYAAWVYRIATGSDDTVLMISDGTAGPDNSEIEMRVTAADKFQFVMDTGGTLSNASVPLNEWAHLAASRSGTNLNLYVNGIKEPDTVVTSANLNFSTCNLYIGMEVDSGCSSTQGNWWTGKIDDIRIYNYAMTESQIKAVMNDNPVNFGPSAGAP